MSPPAAQQNKEISNAAGIDSEARKIVKEAFDFYKSQTEDPEASKVINAKLAKLGKRAAQEIIRLTSSSNEPDLITAQTLLTASGRGSVDYLNAAILSTNATVRFIAAAGLSSLYSDSEVRTAATWLNTPSSKRREAASVILSVRATEAERNMILAALPNSSANEEFHLFGALARIGKSEDRKLIVSSTSTGKLSTQVAATRALASFKENPDEMLRLLERITVNHSNAEVRHQSVAGIWDVVKEMPPETDIPRSLIYAAQAALRRGENLPATKELANQILANISGAEAAKGLEIGMVSADIKLRSVALNSLVNKLSQDPDSSTAAASVLSRIAQVSPDSRLEIATAISTIKWCDDSVSRANIIQVIDKLMNQSDSKLNEMVQKTLVSFFGKAHSAELLGYFDNRDTVDISSQVVNAFGEIWGTNSATELGRIIYLNRNGNSNSDKNIVAGAIAALGRYGTQSDAKFLTELLKPNQDSNRQNNINLERSLIELAHRLEPSKPAGIFIQQCLKGAADLPQAIRSEFLSLYETTYALANISKGQYFSKSLMNHLVSERQKHDSDKGIEDNRSLAVVVFQRGNDWNGAFYQFEKQIQSLVDHGYKVLFYEASSPKEIVENIKNASKHRKIDVYVPGAHGNETLMIFGNANANGSYPEEATLGLKDRELLNSVSSSFADEVKIPIIACLNGHGRMLAENLANLHREIVPQAAPEGISAMTTSGALIEFEYFENGKFYRAHYNVGEEKTYRAQNKLPEEYQLLGL